MIYTFYSYKGGVGRSMALANVAEWLCVTVGVRVVIVDWDLEAPGLEAFFPSDERAASIDRQPGLIDILLEFKADLPYLDLPPDGDLDATVDALTEQLAPLRSRVFPLRHPLKRTDGRDSGMWILPAGRRGEESFAAYSDAVQDFDWNDFYSRHRGQAFFEWLRRQLVAPDLADVALIDARTGFSEMGGVATRQLADVIVSMCVPNTQNIEGVLKMTESFARPAVLKARGRALTQVVVPTRIENSESDARNYAKFQFEDQMSHLLPEAMQGRSFWDLRIPYVPKYAYREKLAINANDANEDLVAAYTTLGTQLVNLAPAGSVIRTALEEMGTRDAPTQVSVARIKNVPPRLPLLVGRDVLLSELRSRLSPSATPIVLYGLGGVGKTAVAVEFAHRFTADYQVTWWIDATSPERIAQGYTALARELGPVTASDPIAFARDWLTSHEGWLLVFDGAEGPETLAQHMPRERRGHVLITSLNPRWPDIGTAMEVPVLDVDDAIDLVRRRTGEAEPTALAAIADTLGEHPLALEEACAYMDATGRSIAGYRELYDREGAKFLRRAGEQRSPGHSLTQIWEVSYRELLRDTRARDLLALFSMLANDVVDVNALTTGKAAKGAEFLWDEATVDEAVIGLRRYSFVTSRDRGYWVHPLLAACVRMWLGDDESRRWNGVAIAVMRSALAAPDVEEPLLAQARATVDRAPLDSPAAVELLEDISRHHERMGRIADARAALDEAVRRAKSVRGDHVADRAMRARLMLLVRHDDLAGAESVLREDLAWARTKATKLQPAIAVDLAVVLLRRNEFAEAERLIGSAATADRALLQVLLARIAIEARRTGSYAIPPLGQGSADRQAKLRRELERFLTTQPPERIADGFLRDELPVT